MLALKFLVGSHNYGIDSTCIVEVVPWIDLRPIAHAPKQILGHFSYRGSIIPVIDVGLLLGAEAAETRLSSRIIVVRQTSESTSRLIGLLANCVSDVIRLQAADLKAPGVHLPLAPYLGAVAETSSGLLQLIEVDRVLASEPLLRPTAEAGGREP